MKNFDINHLNRQQLGTYAEYLVKRKLVRNGLIFYHSKLILSKLKALNKIKKLIIFRKIF